MVNALIDSLKERVSKAVAFNQSVGVILPSSNYSDLIQAFFEYIRSRPEDAWVYVTITKPYENIVKQFGELAESKNIRFVDCISRAAGISKTDPNCVYVESPSMLEKLGLEIINIFKTVDEKTNKYLILDSLSTLIIYNDQEIVTEFFYHLANRTRSRNIHIISLAIEEEGMDKFNKLLYLNDKILKVRDSFI
jgi:archaellum biogenesis ATPase FlaH